MKSAEVLLKPGDIPAAMRRAFSALRNGPAGPVVVELTADVCAQEVPDDALDAYVSPPRAVQSPAPDAVRAAVDLLAMSKQPVLWAGGGVLFGQATDELRQLAERASLPVFVTMQGKSAIDETHPLCLGAGGMTTTEPARAWLDRADVLLAVGTSLTRTPYGQRLPRNARVIHNTDNPADIGKDENVHVALPGDAKLTLQAILAEFDRRVAQDDLGASSRVAERANVESRIVSARDQWNAVWEPALSGATESDGDRLSYYRVIRALNDSLDRDNSIVTHDAGAPRDCLVPFYAATTPHSYVGWGKTTHLGFGIPLMPSAPSWPTPMPSAAT